MRYVHPAFMAALFLLGFAVAGWGGPVRRGSLSGQPSPEAMRRHRRGAWAFATLMTAGYGGGLLSVWALRPALLFRSVHFQVGSILLGLLAAVLFNALEAHRGTRWALHLHPLLATVLLVLYLVQVALGLNLLGYAPVPAVGPAGPSASPRMVEAACPAAEGPARAGGLEVPLLIPGLDPPEGVEPEEPTALRPRYAICPKRLALPAPCWVVET